MPRMTDLLIVFLMSACLSACFAPRADFDSAEGLPAEPEAARLGESPSLRIVDAQGQALVGREVEVYAHRTHGPGMSWFGSPKYNAFALVEIAAGTTDSEGRIPLDIAGRSFGVDDGDSDDIRVAVYEDGRLKHLEFLQGLTANLSVTLPAASRMPAQHTILRFVGPDGSPVVGLTVRCLSRTGGYQEPDPYSRARFGPSNAQGLVYLPYFERGGLVFQLEVGAEVLRLAFSREEQLAPHGGVKEIRLPGWTRLVFDCSGLGEAMAGRLRLLGGKSEDGHRFSSERELRFPAQGELAVDVLDLEWKQVLLEARDENSRLVRLVPGMENSDGPALARHFGFARETVEPARGRIVDSKRASLEAPDLSPFKAEALATYSQDFGDLFYQFRVVNPVTPEGVFQLPRFPENATKFEVAPPGINSFSGEPERNVEGWDFQFRRNDLFDLFSRSRDSDSDFPAAPREDDPDRFGVVVDRSGKPCPFARIDVYDDQAEVDYFFNSSYRRKRLYAFCDSRGRFAFKMSGTFIEIEASHGELDGDVDYEPGRTEYRIVVD